MGVDQQLPPKREVALALLQGAVVSVYLDPRGEDVLVPPWFKKQPQLMLQVGLNMPVPIHDLDIGEEALSCTLSFNRRPEFCRIPWGSIYALVGQDGRGMLWPEDVPPEVAAQAEGRSTQKASSHLRAVPDEGTEADEPRQLSSARSKKATKSAAGSGAAEKRKKKAAARTEKKKLEEAHSAASAEAKGAAHQTERKEKRELPSYLRVVK